jgi:hypothetical protein
MFTQKKAKRSNLTIGLVQALGVAGYVLLIAAAVSTLERIESNSPQILAAAAFLTAFVVSALVCGSLILAYPATLALKGKVKDALEIIAWSAAALATFVMLFLAIVIMF